MDSNPADAGSCRFFVAMARSTRIDISRVFVLAAAISGSLAASRARMRLAFPKNLFISVFEWFGELGFFCARLFRAALVPPYEFGELLRQCDETRPRRTETRPCFAVWVASQPIGFQFETRARQKWRRY